MYHCKALGRKHTTCALRDSAPFVQFKKQSWRGVTFTKVTLLHGCFSRFLKCTNGTKSRNASHMSWSVLNPVSCILSFSAVVCFYV